MAESPLLCEENLSGSDEKQQQQEEEDEYQQGIDNADDEYFQVLIHREINCPRFTGFPENNDYFMNCYLMKQCRLEAIQWILNTRAKFRFRIQTAYLSVTYFDRYLSRTVLENATKWKVRVVWIACLSLAVKVEEIDVPALTCYPMEDYKFDSGFIKETEIKVLLALEWRMDSVTPFHYVNYFISKFFNHSPPQRNLRGRVSELIMATIKDIYLMTHRPSAIAGAATLVVLDQNLSREAVESKINALSLNGFPQIEDVLFCYNKLQELEREKVQLPNSGTRTPAGLSPSQFGGRPTVNPSTKRKRGLDFRDLE